MAEIEMPPPVDEAMLARFRNSLRWRAAADHRRVDAVPVVVSKISISDIVLAIPAVRDRLAFRKAKFRGLFHNVTTRCCFYQAQYPFWIPLDEDPVAVTYPRRQIAPVPVERLEVGSSRRKHQGSAHTAAPLCLPGIWNAIGIARRIPDVVAV